MKLDIEKGGTTISLLLKQFLTTLHFHRGTGRYSNSCLSGKFQHSRGYTKKAAFRFY
jgi:hypothetical protein